MHFVELSRRCGGFRETVTRALRLLGLSRTGFVSRYIQRVPEIVSQSPEFLVREVGRTLQSYMHDLK